MSTATTTLAPRAASAPATGAAARLFATDADLSQALLRVTLAGVMFPHGAQKLLGWWGGYGFEGTMGFLTAQVGLPWIVAFLVIVAESVGALALAAGFLSRVAAAGLAAIMAGAIFTAHLGHGFFMNWNGNQAGEGFEYHLLVIGIALAVVIRGGGAWSVDRLLARRSQG